MAESYLDEEGVVNLWAKIKRTFVTGSTYASRNQTVDNKLAALEARILALENNGGGSGGNAGGGGSTDSSNTGGEGTTIIGLNKLEGCSVSGNNAITVDGVEDGYTLVYLDSEGNPLSNYEEITI